MGEGDREGRESGFGAPWRKLLKVWCGCKSPADSHSAHWGGAGRGGEPHTLFPTNLEGQDQGDLIQPPCFSDGDTEVWNWEMTRKEEAGLVLPSDGAL